MKIRKKEEIGMIKIFDKIPSRTGTRGLAFALAAVLSAAAIQPVYAQTSVMDVFCAPADLTEMEDGAFLVTDTYNKVVWKVQNGRSEVYAGAESVQDPYGEPLGGYYDGIKASGYFQKPWAVTPFLEGYAVSDPDNHVVRYLTEKEVQTAVGTGKAGYSDGIGVNAAFNYPTGLAVDGEGSLYVADTGNGCIRKVSTKGLTTTWLSGLQEPTGLCWKDGALYIAETGRNRIVKAADGQITETYGMETSGKADGPLSEAQFNAPQGVEVDDDGCIYVADSGNNAVRRIQGGIVTTLISRDERNPDQYPMRPLGMYAKGHTLYVCDNFAQKLFTISVD